MAKNTPSPKDPSKDEPNEFQTRVPAPNGVDKRAWFEAEKAVLAKQGGFAGASDEAKKRQVQEAYDQIAQQRDDARKWEGRE